MPKTLSIEIETEKEEGLYSLLNHVFREITEGEAYTNQEVEGNARFGGEWLEIVEGAFKGKYKWTKD